MHLNTGDEIKISSSSLPYARYFSFQAYSIPDFVSSASMRDVDILPLPPSHPHHGPNAYTNLSAAMAGTKQGGYEVVITAHGNKGYPNELRALADDRDSGFFIVFFRIYQDRADSPPSLPPSSSSSFQADLNKCFGPQGLYPEETPQEWGWACPPTVAVRRVFQHGPAAKFEPLPMCGYRRKRGITYNDVTPPVIHCAPNREPNRPYNFFLPSPYYLKQKFANKDAKYLFSCAEAPGVPEGTNGVGGWVHRKDEKKDMKEEEGKEEEDEETELWARVTGKLPRTANELYAPPFIANFSDYDVRYVSLSSVGRSLPYRGYQTLHDADIIEHYLREVGPKWLEGDRSFTLWFGPPHVVVEEDDESASSSSSSSLLPAVVVNEKALFLPWGKSFRGGHIPFPGVLYRQILSRGQVLRTRKEGGRTGGRNGNSSIEKKGEDEQSCSLHAAATTAAPTVSEWGRAAAAAAAGSPPTAGLAEIIPPTCEKRDERAEEGKGKEVVSKHMCCGPSAPEWCHDPSFIASKMKGFYPSVVYFYRRRSRRGREGGREVKQEDKMERIGGEEDDSRKVTLVEGEESSQPLCFEEEEEVVLGGGGGEGGEVSLSTEMASSYLNLLSDIWTIVYSYIHF